MMPSMQDAVEARRSVEADRQVPPSGPAGSLATVPDRREQTPPQVPLSSAGGRNRPAGEQQGPAERGFRNAHLAPMPLDGTLHDRKAQPVAHLLAGGRTELHKGLKHPAALRFRNTRPVILHAQLVPAVALWQTRR